MTQDAPLDEHDARSGAPAARAARPPPRRSSRRRSRARRRPRRSSASSARVPRRVQPRSLGLARPFAAVVGAAGPGVSAAFRPPRPAARARASALERHCGAGLDRQTPRRSTTPVSRSRCDATVEEALRALLSVSAPAWRRLTACQPADRPRPCSTRALDLRVERVQPVQRDRLGRAEAPTGRRSAPWWQSTQCSSASRRSALSSARRARGDQAQAELDVSEHPPLGACGRSPPRR